MEDDCWHGHCLWPSLIWQAVCMERSKGLCWLKLIAQIRSLPCGDSDRLRFTLFSLHYLFTLQPCAQITIATRRASKQFKGTVAWKFACHPRSRRASDTCRGVGAESLGVFWIRDWIFLWRWGKRFMARSHESVSCSLKLLPRWLLLSWERIILSPPVSFSLLSSSSFSFAFHHLRFCVDLFRDPILALASFTVLIS